ncbi:MFS transporter [Breznakiella homolactica]|uniref:MFS transporter n=1 Tax=Breznakiella homolactica TaxID=2798577 RepID=A0A7T7XR37_9SPIR|nr:MFS transporter [Breznakiella homolactica]QQO10950.1 MFS transporter [Breznakiella homolactica]
MARSESTEKSYGEILKSRFTWKTVYKPESKVLRFLSVLLLSGISYGLYRGVQDNYLAEIVHINEFQRGIVEFFRELPGLLVVFILAWMYRFSESRIFKIGMAIMLAGMAGLFISGSGKFIVVLFIVIFSAGEHIVMPVKSTISLELAKRDKAGASLGITSSISHVGNITGYIIVTVVFFIFARLGFGRNSIVQFKTVFALATVLMVAALLVSLAIKESAVKVKRRRFYFAKKFTKYYMLEVFYGARKQIFITFAPYVLILQYGADASVIALLMAVCSGFGIIFSPLMGKLIDRLGYKFIMVTDTLLLMVVCFFYGFAHRLFSPGTAFIVVCVNYVLDSLISLASMASNVYVQDIASNQEEITATISTGISVNHVISILIALLGGWIWTVTGIEVLFSISAFLGLLNTVYAATIKVAPKKQPAEEGLFFSDPDE